MVDSLFSRLSIQEKPKPPKFYNLASYSDAFKARICELAFPKEVYNLQLADIDGTVDLKLPVYSIETVHDIKYDAKLNKVSVRKTESSKPVLVKKNTLYDVQNAIHLHNAVTAQLKPSYFHQIYNVPKDVMVYDSAIDIPFLIATCNSIKLVPGIKFLYSYSCERKWPNYDPNNKGRHVFCRKCNQVYYADVDMRSELSYWNPFNTNKCVHKKIKCEKPKSSKKTNKAIETTKKLIKKFTDSKAKCF